MGSSVSISTRLFEEIDVMAWEKPLFEVTGGMFVMFCIVAVCIYCIRANATLAELGKMLALLES